MGKNVQIQIAEPCTQQWQDMQISGDGRFCSSCLKTVVDFSAMSDGEILSWMAKTDKALCGRFTTDQLNRNLNVPAAAPQRASLLWHYLVAGLLLSTRLSAQTKPPAPPPSYITQSSHAAATPSHTALTPMLNKGLHPLSTENILVEVDSPKYDSLPPVVVSCPSSTLGKYTLGGLTVTRRRDTAAVLTDLWKDTLALVGIAPKFHKPPVLYPNPVHRGASLSLALPAEAAGRKTIQLFNSAGTLLQTQSVECGDAASQATVPIPSTLPAGIYFIKISQPQSKAISTQKLVVL